MISLDFRRLIQISSAMILNRLRAIFQFGKGGRCNPKTIDFFIELCKENLGHFGGSGSAECRGFWTGHRFRFEEIEQIRKSAIFDENFYLKSYGHKLASGVTAIEDFCDRGWRAKRDPNPFFSVSRYLRNEKSVDSSGNLVNPLIDFLAVNII